MHFEIPLKSGMPYATVFVSILRPSYIQDLVFSQVAYLRDSRSFEILQDPRSPPPPRSAIAYCAGAAKPPMPLPVTRCLRFNLFGMQIQNHSNFHRLIYHQLPIHLRAICIYIYMSFFNMLEISKPFMHDMMPLTNFPLL